VGSFVIARKRLISCCCASKEFGKAQTFNRDNPEDKIETVFIGSFESKVLTQKERECDANPAR
jgi:hypothetical protein